MIEVIVTYACFCFEIIAFNYLDYKKYKTILNPIFFLSVPFSIILLFCVILNRQIDFIQFQPLALWIWIIGLLFFWLGNPFVVLLLKSFGYFKQKNTHNLYAGYKSFSLFHIAVAMGILFACILLLKGLQQAGVGSKDLGEDIGQGGIAGRVADLLLVAFPFYYSYKLKLIIRLPLLALLFLFIISLGSKTWLTYSFIATIIVWIYNGHKINIKLLCVSIIALFVLFGLYYWLNTEIDDSAHFIEFVSRHFYFYITSGILPMSEIYYSEIFIPPQGINHPFVNLFLSWIGEAASFHSPIWISTDKILGTQSNVFTFFGQLWINGSYLEFIIYSFLSGLLSYFICDIYYLKSNIFGAICYTYTLSVLFFGWFNWGFIFLRIWEIYIICIIFNWLCKLHIKIH